MNNISQISVFDYRKIEILGDLERIKLFFENLDDKELCESLENERKNGRNDYPVRVMLNLIYAMKIFGHRSVESFRRELSRNSQLRALCGLSDGKFKFLGKRKNLVPPARVFSGFIRKLKKHENEIKNINEKLIKYMYENLEKFGKNCAIDGKFLDTYANHYSKEKCVDNRAEHDATTSCKTYYMKDGTTKKEWHYGFRAHIICYAKYGLPIKYKLTPANNSEQTELDNLLKELASNDDARYKLEKMENLMGDAGYDKANNALRYTRQSTGRKIYRIPLSTDYRIFVPIARDSKRFKKKYKMRTEVERLNGRLDRDYMFNDHFIRGKEKMELMLDLSFLVMLTMAKGHIINKQENIRSLVA